MGKKMTDKTLMGSLLLLGVAILAIVYFLPVSQLQSQIDEYTSKNAQLESTIASLQEYYDNRAFYVEQTAELQKEIVVIANEYPSAYRPEDYIMEAVAIGNAADDIIFEQIELKDAVSMAVVDAQTVQGAQIENLTETIEFNRQDVVYTNDVEYLSLKQALAEIFTSPYCANIQSITYTTDDKTGRINGDIVLGYFYVTGTGVEYVAPEIPEYQMGTDNIFGHYETEEDNLDLGNTVVE